MRLVAACVWIAPRLSAVSRSASESLSDHRIGSDVPLPTQRVIGLAIRICSPLLPFGAEFPLFRSASPRADLAASALSRAEPGNGSAR